MKVKAEVTYVKTTPAGAVYSLSIDGLATKPELVFPVVEGVVLKDSAKAELDLEAPKKKGKK